MKTLLKNGKVVNVFTGEIEAAQVLIEDGQIAGVGGYTDADADVVEDVGGQYICPGFIDGHIHIESTMLLPAEFCNTCVPHGTTTVVADPHEIANVCGAAGISYMLEASEGLPLTVYIMLPSCVPASPFDEAGAVLDSRALEPFFGHPRVLGLGEVMNYPGVIAGDKDVLAKLQKARDYGAVINGHAPLLSGKELDKYIRAGIRDEHECTSLEEAKERIRKGQWVMIRQGTSAQNLMSLIGLFAPPFAHRCLLVTDDKHPADLMDNGHIDNSIRLAVSCGESAVTGIQMATIQAAQCFGLKNKGAVAPGYDADILVLSDLDAVRVAEVYQAGKKVAAGGRMLQPAEAAKTRYDNLVRKSFHMDALSPADFYISPKGSRCRVIQVVPKELLTKELVCELNFENNNGVDTEKDILKLAVAERHHSTGHIGLGYITGIGLKTGAIAASVSHDSHNLIIIGTNDADMAVAGNRVRELGGGSVVVDGGVVAEEMPLPIAGLMSDKRAAEVAQQNAKIRAAVYRMGAPKEIEPFMNMAFISLPVIPSLKLTTKGLVDVIRQKLVDLFL